MGRTVEGEMIFKEKGLQCASLVVWKGLSIGVRGFKAGKDRSNWMHEVSKRRRQRWMSN